MLMLAACLVIASVFSAIKIAAIGTGKSTALKINVIWFLAYVLYLWTFASLCCGNLSDYLEHAIRVPLAGIMSLLPMGTHLLANYLAVKLR